jgi:hypothetical protein
MLVVAAGCGTDRPVATPLGPLRNPSGVCRDGGWSVPLGDEVLWLFGDTLWTTFASNSAGFGDEAGPTRNIPREFIPLTAQERARFAAPGDRVAIWPTGAVALGADEAAVFFQRIHVMGPRYVFEGWGIASFRAGDAHAERVVDVPTNDVAYGRPVRAGRFVYTYGSRSAGGGVFSTKVARVPVEDLYDTTAWRYWTARGWGTNPADAIWAFAGPSAPDVAWNEHLGRFVALVSRHTTGEIVILTSSSPVGPWEHRGAVSVRDDPEQGLIYQAIQHPEAQQGAGARIMVTHYHREGLCGGEIRRTMVDL